MQTAKKSETNIQIFSTIGQTLISPAFYFPTLKSFIYSYKIFNSQICSHRSGKLFSNLKSQSMYLFVFVQDQAKEIKDSIGKCRPPPALPGESLAWILRRWKVLLVLQSTLGFSLIGSGQNSSKGIWSNALTTTAAAPYLCLYRMFKTKLRNLEEAHFSLFYPWPVP